MGVSAIVIIVIVLAVAAIGVGAALAAKRRRAQPVAPPAPAAEPHVDRPEPAPMTGLEEALNRATDRSGTTMADRLESESEKVEGFRVTDDTGPLLRRALDRLEPHDDASADAPAPGDGDTASET